MGSVAARHTMHNLITIRGARENDGRDASSTSRRVPSRSSPASRAPASPRSCSTPSQPIRSARSTTRCRRWCRTSCRTTRQPDADVIAELSATIVVDQQRIGGVAGLDRRHVHGRLHDAAHPLLAARNAQRTPLEPLLVQRSSGDVPRLRGHRARLPRSTRRPRGPRRQLLAEGATVFPNFGVDSWYWSIFRCPGSSTSTRRSGTTREQRNQLLYLPEGEDPARHRCQADQRRVREADPEAHAPAPVKELDSLQPHIRAAVEAISTQRPCAACGGTRLNEAALATRVRGLHRRWLGDGGARARGVRLGDRRPDVAPAVDALARRLESLDRIGLGYLS
jgi:hypothetical protein